MYLSTQFPTLLPQTLQFHPTVAPANSHEHYISQLSKRSIHACLQTSHHLPLVAGQTPMNPGFTAAGVHKLLITVALRTFDF
jgi:hypothetical protein